MPEATKVSGIAVPSMPRIEEQKFLEMMKLSSTRNVPVPASTRGAIAMALLVLADWHERCLWSRFKLDKVWIFSGSG